MLNLIIRLAMALIGLALLVETFMPPISETTRIDRHELVNRRDTDSNGSRRTSTAYRLHFFGGKLASCDVGITAYDATADGDAVTVRHSRLFKTCTAIDKDGVKVYVYRGWRWFYWPGPCFCCWAPSAHFPHWSSRAARSTRLATFTKENP